jgi:hypothetical protein
MSERHSDERAPRPEWLAAHLDGELGEAERARVEAWLADHPEAAAEVEAHRRLARLYQEAEPPAPADAAWDAVLARVEAGLRVPPPRRWHKVAGVAGIIGLVAAAAAAVALVLTFGGGATPTPPPEEPWPVLSADEVRIESMHDADRGALVVGEPPVSGPLELLAADEVKVSHLDRDDQGRMPQLAYTDDTLSVPMIVMPPSADPGRDP